MLNDEICKLRDKLNNSIASGEDYSVIYKLSVELDELIAEYYRRKKERSKLRVSTVIWLVNYEFYNALIKYIRDILKRYIS